jgi:hypothetical protein
MKTMTKGPDNEKTEGQTLRHDHEIVTTSLAGYMAQVEKEAPKPATPHHPTAEEIVAFNKFCLNTCHGDCEMCKVVPLYEPRNKNFTLCEVCGQEIPEGESAHATTSGSIINGQFEMDENEWLMLVCETCGEQIQYVSGNLETALDAIDR